jgi:death-on-curing protein
MVVEKRLSSIPYPGENPFVSISSLKHVRKLCHLTAEDGIDSAAFYDADTVIDSFINQYRGVLRKLARR